jgi:CDP-diacylglycerol---serine O-phosphatidyltransferase
MKSMKYIVPNGLTSLNLFSGALAVVMAFSGNESWPVYLILMAALFDFLDGFSAKLLHAISEFGKQLDSLADLVSFGFAPSVLIYKSLEKVLGNGDFFSSGLENQSTGACILLFSSFLFLVFAALRLARFNIQTTYTTDFIGLPVPAATLIVVSIWIAMKSDNPSILKDFLSNQYILIGCNILLSLLMVSKLTMLSLKFKGAGFKINLWRYLLLSGGIILFLIFRLDALFYIMAYYLFLSFIRTIIPKPDRG